MRMSSVVIGVMVAASASVLCLSNCVAADKQFLDPQPLQTFDGVSWSGLSLGQTTPADLRKQYRLGPGGYDPSLQLAQPKGAVLRVDALFAGRSKTSVTSCISLQYQPGHGPDLAAIKAAAGEEQDYYLRGHLEDWRISEFPKRGIVLFVLSGPGGPEVVQALLLAPAAVEQGVPGLTTDVCPVEARIDPNAGRPKVAEFGNANVTFDVQGIALKDADKQKSDVVAQIQGATARGTLHYRDGADGTYAVTIKVSCDAKGACSETVSASINADGPYGPASGGSTMFLPVVPAVGGTVDYSIALAGVMVEAEKQFAADIRGQGPPPLEQVRETAWTKILEGLRAASSVAVGAEVDRAKPVK